MRHRSIVSAIAGAFWLTLPADELVVKTDAFDAEANRRSDHQPI